MDTIRKGNAAEAAVLHQLISADIPVLIPFGGGLAFDLGAVVPPDGHVMRIQVKSGRIRKGCVEFNTCSTDHGSGRRRYVGRADMLAVHVGEADQIFMVPVEECPISTGYLRLEVPRNNQRRRVRFARDYAFDAWLSNARRARDLWQPELVAPRDHLRHPPAEGPAEAA